MPSNCVTDRLEVVVLRTNNSADREERVAGACILQAALVHALLGVLLSCDGCLVEPDGGGGVIPEL